MPSQAPYLETDQTLRAADGYPLAATLFEPVGQSPKAIILINSATAVKRRYYKAYARWLAEQGYRVLTYDYRGIGDSKPKQMRGFAGTLHHWGSQDCEGVSAWLKEQYPNLSLGLIGHSIGGTILGFMASNHRFAAALTVGAQTSYYQDWAPKQRRKIYWLWHIVIPTLTKLVGYFPGKRLGMLEDIPTGVVRDWHSRRLDPSIVNQLRQNNLPENFGGLRAPVLAVSLTDDPIGTEAAVQRLHRHYENAQVEVRLISPETLNVPEIGHFGFFRNGFAQTLWPLTTAWFETHLTILHGAPTSHDSGRH